MRFLICFVLLCLSVPVQAREMGGVMIQESLRTEDGIELTLNGAGIRSKFIFDIYVAMLYLQQPSQSVDDVLAQDGGKRIIMHFLYDKVEAQKLVDAWNDGFSANLSEGELMELKEKISEFNALFVDVEKNQRIVLNYIPGKGTGVQIAGEEKGVIEGKPFNDALLKIWLGKKPVTNDLKKQLLGK